MVSHIRHTYTKYDILLREGTWEDARRIVGPDCIAMLVKWRGEDEPVIPEFEDVFREVVVIDDDEESVGMNKQVSSHRSRNNGRDRDHALEIFSDRILAVDLSDHGHDASGAQISPASAARKRKRIDADMESGKQYTIMTTTAFPDRLALIRAHLDTGYTISHIQSQYSISDQTDSRGPKPGRFRRQARLHTDCPRAAL